MPKTYNCQICNYETTKKFNYEKHLKSKKHKANQNQDENKDIIINELKSQVHSLQTTLQNEIVSLKETMNAKSEPSITNNDTTNNKHTNSHNSTNTNSHNTTFNLQFFLNDTCKDAMNISEFIKSIEVNIPELKNMAKKGYVEGISSLIIDNLNKLDVTKRPMHCSDTKRETIYIRDNDIWEKENEEKKKTRTMISKIQQLNTRALQDKYQKEYPHCLTDYDSKEHNEYGEIAFQSLGGHGEYNNSNKKIIRKVAKEISIDKESILNNEA